MTHDSLRVSALGAVVSIQPSPESDPTSFVEVRDAWTGALTTADATTEVMVGSGDIAYSLERLSVDVTLAALEHNRGNRLMFHAGGVASSTGNVVAYVGPSGRGKTTLSRTLGARFGYVSDEAIAVDETRRVFPYRKPLSLVRPGQPKDQISPQQAHLLPLPTEELTLVSLLLLDRSENAVEPTVERLSIPDALSELVPQISYLGWLEKPLQTLCSLIDSVGGVFRLTYSEAESVIDVVGNVLAAPEGPLEMRWEPVEADLLPPGVQDAVLFEDELVILAHSTVHILVGIAPTIWVESLTTRSLHAVTRAVVNNFGTPPEGDAQEIVRRQHTVLSDLGLLPVMDGE